MSQETDTIPEVGVWAAFAEEIGGVFSEGPHSKPSIMHIAAPGTVHYEFKGHEVLVDTLVSPGNNNQTPQLTTRFRTLINNEDGFRFKVYREIDSLFASTLKFLRLLKDVEIGDPAFDAQFIMRGNDDEKVKHFFSNPTMQEKLGGMEDDCWLEIRDKDSNLFKRSPPKGVDILTWVKRGLVSEVDGLRSTSELFHFTIELLIEMDIVSSHVPEARITDYT